MNPRAIKLQCPLVSISNTVEMLVWEDQRVDLGAIAGAFGLAPQTVRLNSHFISRGVDNIACCVTWKSLLSCFASKGLPTNVILVDGKLTRVGTKRSLEPQDSVSVVTQLVKKSKKTSEGESGSTVDQGIGFKRLRINENCTATSNNGVANNILRCSPISGKKRMREDEIEEAIVSVPSKKIV